jgi:hypothetical protein
VFNFIEALPELGPSLVLVSENVGGTRVFCSKKLEPLVFTFRVVKKMPNPFGHKSHIENSGVKDAQATLVLRTTNIKPLHPVVLALSPTPSQKKHARCLSNLA